MKVACPHCSAAYNVDDRRVPAAGLNVRCPKCRNTFPVRPDAGAPAADEAVPLPAPAGAPAPSAAATPAASVRLPPPAPPPLAPPPPPDLFGVPPPGPAPIALPPPDPFGAPSTEPSSAVFAPGPDLFDPAPPPASIPLPPPPLPGPFATEPFTPEPFAPEPFAAPPPIRASPRDPLPAARDPLPVPGPDPRPAADPFGEPAALPSAPPVESGDPLAFGEVDLSSHPPPAPSRAAPAPASRPGILPSPGEELEMLFAEGAAPRGAGTGFKIRRRSGKVFGPFDPAQVVDMLAKGELMGNEDVASDGGAWTPIGAVPAFGEALRKLTSEPVGPAAAPTAAPHEPQRLVAYGDRMAPARGRDGERTARSIPSVRIAGVAAAILLVGAAGVGAGFTRYGFFFMKGLRRGDAVQGAALAAQARAAAARGDHASQRAALDLAAQAVAADPRSLELAALHAEIVAALERGHGAPREALEQARNAADRLDQDEKGEIGTLAARLAVTLATTPGRATQPHESALEQAAQKRPPDAEHLFLLANAALARGDAARAAALFGRLQAIEPAGARALHGAGRAALAQHDGAAAKSAFGKALAADPGHLATHLELAALAEAEGDLAQAEAQLAPVLAKGAETKLAPADRARALAVRGLVLARSHSGAAEADAALAAAVQADPRLAEVRIALARHRLGRGDPTGAVQATDPVADQATGTPALAAIRIRALALAGRALDASSLAAAALQGAPGDLGLLLAKAAALEASAKPQEAAALYRDAATRDPAAFEPRLALGRIALSRKDLAQAAAEIAVAVEKGPREPATHAALGELRAAQGDLAGAEGAFRAALALDAEHASAEIGLAKLAFARGDLAGAKARLERALAAEPRSVEGRVAYGTLLWKAKDLPAAEKAFQSAVDLAPQHATALARLGAVKLERGDLAGAVKHLTTASNEDGRLAEARLWLGRALLAKGETPGAIGQLRKAVDLDPAADHLLSLGDALDRSGAVPEAVQAYQAAAAADPRSPEPHERIGALNAGNGRCDEAVPAFERAIALAPRVSRLRIALGDCKAKLGKSDEAAKLFREVLKGEPSAVQVLYRLARAVHESETPRAALPWYERAAREDGQNPMPHYYLGYMYKERGQRAKAVQEFKRYLALKPDAEERRDIEAEIEDLGAVRER